MSHYNITISHSSDAASLLKDHMADLDHEELWGVFLNGQRSIIATEMLTKGTLKTTPIDARTVVKRALLNNAVGVILIHNHPSGSPRPSRADIRETSQVQMACNMMDISLIDHLVLADGSYYSFSDERIQAF